MTESINLVKASKLEITVLVDNYFDALLPPQPGVTRPPLAKDGHVSSRTLTAEHGLSILVDTWSNGFHKRVLLDTGYNQGTVLRNMETLSLAPSSIDALVLSHGHMDHTGAVNEILERVGKPIPVYFHPGIFSERYIERPGVGIARFPQPIHRAGLETTASALIDHTGPVLLADNMIMATGAIPRLTSFEKGMRGAKMMKDGELVEDNMEDDQAIVMNVKDWGLVVISGCAHSGIVNSLNYARKLTSENKVCAVMGGFHLAGPDMGPVIDATISEIKSMAPWLVMPMHCTGFGAIANFKTEFPDSFVLSGVGTKITLPY